MGFLTGTASFVRFSIEGQLPESFWDFIAEKVAAHAFQDIDDTLDEYSIGWVSAVNMFDADFAYGSYAVGDYITLSMRVDERKVSPSVLKKCVLKEEERVKKERQIPRLNRSTKMEIKERIRTELVRKSVPVPAVYDICWNLSEGTLYFFSTSKKAVVLLEELFKETFGLSLILQIPWLTAAHVADKVTRDRLDALRPSVLV
ncbi:MAG: recombination-associated protein RdgC [Desulfobulbaceae bacterium]|nr:recombination-associated protein RdgC [Desulfobulbaceae bacterium]